MAPNARPMRGPGGRRGMMGQGGPKGKNPGAAVKSTFCQTPAGVKIDP